MPSSLQHHEQAQHNLDFLSQAYGQEYWDWCVTVAFYAAVHTIEYAIFAAPGVQKYRQKLLKQKLSGSAALPQVAGSQGIPPPENISWHSATPHQIRNSLVKENFQEISDEYVLLYRKSRGARYECYKFDKEEVDVLILPALRKIIDWSKQRFGTTLTFDLK